MRRARRARRGPPQPRRGAVRRASSPRSAASAEAVEDDLVGVELEAARQQPADPGRAGLHLEDAITAAAVEVMVVPLASELVARRRPGQLDGVQGAVLQQALDGTVDGGEA